MFNSKKQKSRSIFPHLFMVTGLIGIVMYYTVLGLMFWSSPVYSAQKNHETSKFSVVHKQWNKVLDEAEKRVEQGELNDGVTEELNLQITDVRTAAREYSSTLTDEIRELNQFSEALGTAPREGEPTEAMQVQLERKRLEKSMTEVMGQAKQLDLLIERADQLLEQISLVEVEHVVSSLINQGPLPLDPRNWVKAGSQFFKGYKSLVADTDKKNEEADQPILILIPILFVCLMASLLVGYWIGKILFSDYRRDPALDNPSYLRKVVAALVVGFCRGIIPALVFTMLSSLLWSYWLQYQLNPEFSWPVGIYKAVIFYLLIAGLIRAVFSPRVPDWNLTSITPEAAKTISYYLHTLAIIITMTIAFEAVLVDTGKSPEFGSVYALIKNSIVSISLLLISRKALWKIPFVQEEGSEESWIARLWFWPYLRFLTILTAAVALICSILGFHNLADFILPRIILTCCLAILIVTARILMQDFFAVLFQRQTGISHSLRHSLSLDQENSERVNFWVMTIIDLLSVLGAAYLLLILWEPPRLALHNDLIGWLTTWFEGVSFGSYTFSLADLLLAILMLFVVLGLTRVIRSLLENKLLPQTRMGIGARTAVSSSVGYLGVLLAVLIAVSTLGIDLTKLALIAGALSVGIGFGLQNIVNNFVSGLILLFEQPVKIGDWVVVGNLEGKVKQINVRATEIETFNRASVIIPNSDLLQTSVTNWTHDTSFGRIELPVGVAYSSDIELVEAILLECAREHSEVLAWPEPYALFVAFGDSSLDFILHIFVDNIERRIRISSDLRKCILAKFREAKIEIPFPQRELTINNSGAGLGED